MQNIPTALRMQYEKMLHQMSIPKDMYRAYQKWLRYYLDFCHKYHFPARKKWSLPIFINKLKGKKPNRESTETSYACYQDFLSIASGTI